MGEAVPQDGASGAVGVPARAPVVVMEKPWVLVRLDDALDRRVAVVVSLGRTHRGVVHVSEDGQHRPEVTRLGGVRPPRCDSFSGHALEHMRRAAITGDALGHVAEYHILLAGPRLLVDASGLEALALEHKWNEPGGFMDAVCNGVEHRWLEPCRPA